MPSKRTIPRICGHCQSDFLVTPSYARLGRDKFCSRACWRASFGTLDERLDRSTNYGAPNGCWEWTGAAINGYGVIRIDGKNVYVHRLTWERSRGTKLESEDVVVCHTCDNPPCRRPDHLFRSTSAGNSADMVAKGRQAAGDRNGGRLHPERVNRGEQVGTAKLTATEVIAIRVTYATGSRSYAALGAQYGVTKQAIRLIVKRLAWQHV